MPLPPNIVCKPFSENIVLKQKKVQEKISPSTINQTIEKVSIIKGKKMLKTFDKNVKKSNASSKNVEENKMQKLNDNKLVTNIKKCDDILINDNNTIEIADKINGDNQIIEMNNIGNIQNRLQNIDRYPTLVHTPNNTIIKNFKEKPLVKAKPKFREKNITFNKSSIVFEKNLNVCSINKYSGLNVEDKTMLNKDLMKASKSTINNLSEQPVTNDVEVENSSELPIYLRETLMKIHSKIDIIKKKSAPCVTGLKKRVSNDHSPVKEFPLHEASQNIPARILSSAEFQMLLNQESDIFQQTVSYLEYFIINLKKHLKIHLTKNNNANIINK